MEKPASKPKFRLDDITTEWSIIHDPAQFVMRYAPAIQRYLAALVRARHDAEDVTQNFFLRVVQHGFLRARQERGRFRDYLKTAVRNAALNFLSRKPAVKVSPLAGGLAVADPAQHTADREWVAQWRRCVLARAWNALKRHQRRSPGNLFYTALRLAVEHPAADAEALAARAGRAAGRTVRADAFRKQLSRARYQFAQFLVDEVAQTLDFPTPEQVEEELIDISRWKYVRQYLPADWRTRGKLAPPK